MSGILFAQLIPQTDRAISGGVQWVVIVCGFLALCIFVGLVVLLVRGFIVRKCRSDERLVIERFGKFLCLRPPGLTLLRPLVDHVKPVPLGVQRFEVKENVRTQEGYFLTIHVMVHGQVLGGEEAIKASAESGANNQDLQKNILLYLYSGKVSEIATDLLKDYLRTKVAGRTYDTIFTDKQAIADDLTHHLADVLARYGFQILRTPITDINPGAEIQHAANQALVEERTKTAVITRAQGEAEAITVRADADCIVEEKKGQGARKRLAEQAKGLLEAFRIFLGEEVVFSPEGVAAILLEMERLNALNGFAQSGGTHAIVVPNNSGLSDEVVGVASAIIAGDTAQGKEGFDPDQFDQHMDEVIKGLETNNPDAARAVEAQKDGLKKAFLGMRNGIAREIVDRSKHIPIAGKRIAKAVEKVVGTEG